MFSQDRQGFVAEVVVTDRSEADSKIKGGAVGRLVGGWSRSVPRIQTVPRLERSACNWLKPVISLGSLGTVLSSGRFDASRT